MDSLVNQLAREMTDAIAAAIANDPKVEACREKARANGFEIRLSLESVIGFVDKSGTGPSKAGAGRRHSARSTFEMSANDRRFLKSLRIAADEATEKEVE